MTPPARRTDTLALARVCAATFWRLGSSRLLHVTLVVVASAWLLLVAARLERLGRPRRRLTLALPLLARRRQKRGLPLLDGAQLDLHARGERSVAAAIGGRQPSTTTDTERVPAFARLLSPLHVHFSM